MYEVRIDNQIRKLAEEMARQTERIKMAQDTAARMKAGLAGIAEGRLSRLF